MKKVILITSIIITTGKCYSQARIARDDLQYCKIHQKYEVLSEACSQNESDKEDGLKNGSDRLEKNSQQLQYEKLQENYKKQQQNNEELNKTLQEGIENLRKIILKDEKN